MRRENIQRLKDLMDQCKSSKEDTVKEVVKKEEAKKRKKKED